MRRYVAQQTHSLIVIANVSVLALTMQLLRILSHYFALRHVRTTPPHRKLMNIQPLQGATANVIRTMYSQSIKLIAAMLQSLATVLSYLALLMGFAAPLTLP